MRNWPLSEGRNIFVPEMKPKPNLPTMVFVPKAVITLLVTGYIEHNGLTQRGDAAPRGQLNSEDGYVD